MKLRLKKKKIKNLVSKLGELPLAATPNVAGGITPATNFDVCDGTTFCHTNKVNQCAPVHTDDCNTTIGDTFTGAAICQTGVCGSTGRVCG
ncbi:MULTISPECIES: hypothetical protein [unclassified Pseudoalteromonas]|uniref:hypothetical protein n=1 Tax=unclassified Pseudoalteromonas TaxID=194690 RepID=UPI0005AADDD9|nr:MULTISPECIES: hypothetical protein [unclassified Pseudoalteromonas]